MTNGADKDVYSPRADAELQRDAEFDQYVDEEHGELEICGQTIAPSDALATDPVRYFEARRAWTVQMEQELRNLVVTEFFHPIAHSFRRYLRGSRTAKEKFEALRDSWEALIHTLLALTLAELRANDDELEDTGIDRRWIESQTIRDRIEVIARVAAWGGDLLSVTGRIPSDCIPKLLELAQHRNDVAHRASRTDAQAARELAVIEPTVMSVMEDLRWLEDWEVLRPTGTMNDGQAQFQRFRGYSAEIEYHSILCTETQRVQLARRPRASDELFALHGDVILCLSPILRPVFEDESHHTRIAFLKKRADRRLVYEVVGRSKELEIVDAATLASLDELKNRFVKTGKGA